MSRKLQAISDASGEQIGFMHWCPGCNEHHAIWTDRANAPRWSFNGDVERPTFNPSVLCYTTHDDDGNRLPHGQRRTLCHYFIRDGMIDFCGDSPHALAGKTVELPDLPRYN